LRRKSWGSNFTQHVEAATTATIAASEPATMQYSTQAARFLYRVFLDIDEREALGAESVL